MTCTRHLYPDLIKIEMATPVMYSLCQPNHKRRLFPGYMHHTYTKGTYPINKYISCTRTNMCKGVLGREGGEKVLAGISESRFGSPY